MFVGELQDVREGRRAVGERGRSDGLGRLAGTQRAVRARHRAGDPRPAPDAHEDLLRLPHRLRRAAELAGLPGLPRACPARCRSSTRQAVDYAIKAALALGCEVQPESIFARKNYFYPDLPKGYQISQYERPLALGGGLDITVDGATTHVGLTRIHMEEDAGKSLHEGFPDSDRRTYVDYNRSGVPLIEIVTEPDMRSAAEAAEFFARLRDILVWLGVNDGNMEEGSLRCDANVSVRPLGADDARHQGGGQERQLVPLSREGASSTRSSGRSRSSRAAAASSRRRGCGTRRPARTHSMRSKEEAHDYRYFPEPDLPPLVVDEARIARVRATMPELPEARRRRFVAQYAIPGVRRRRADAVRGAGRLLRGGRARRRATPKAASNWIMGELLRTMKERGQTIEQVPLSAGGAGRPRSRVDRQGHDQQLDRQGRLREDVRLGPVGRRDRRGRRPRADRRRSARCSASSATSSARNADAVGAVPGRASSRRSASSSAR